MDHVVELSLELEIMLDEQCSLTRLANKKIVELEERITKYGRHTDECDSHTTYCVTKSNPVPYRGTCDCGWAEVTTKKGLEKQE